MNISKASEIAKNSSLSEKETNRCRMTIRAFGNLNFL